MCSGTGSPDHRPTAPGKAPGILQPGASERVYGGAASVTTKVTTEELRRMKTRGEPISVLTAYDYTSALLMDQSGIDVILVGDSVGTVVQGHDTTIPVTLDQMVYHTRCVARAVKRALLVADMPFLSFQVSSEEALRRFAQDLGDTTADKIVCALILGARRRNIGLTRILEDLAESVAEDVAARRMVQAERARQTTTVRYVTLITVVVFGGFLLLGGAYVAPYGTPLGQPILALLLACYVGVLVWLRKMNRAEPLPRLLERVQS